MVDRNKLYEQLVATFVDEVGEHVEAINAGVMALESSACQTDAETTLTPLFRAAHSLKGAARAVDVLPIEQVCHHLEDVLTAIREGSLEFNSEVATLLLNVADRIAGSAELLRQRQKVPPDQFAELTAQLQQTLDGDAPVAETESPPSESVAAVAAADPSPEVPTPEVSDPAPTEDPGTQPPTPTSTDSTTTESTTERQPSRSASPAARALGASVRVAEDKLDGLMAQAGELLVARQQIEIRPSEVEAIGELAAECRSDFQGVQRFLLHLVQHRDDPLLRRSARMSARVEEIIEQTGESLRRLELKLQDLQRSLLADSRQLNHAGQALQEDIHRIRMLPFAEGCAGLERVVRDVSQSTGKVVELTIEGGDIEVDRTVLEGLRDPLLHLVRNAIDHGLETSEQRSEAGKSKAGHITISATLRGSQVDITIADDGRGLDQAAIAQKLRDRGLPEPQDEHELLQTIFLPGFSTAQQVTDLSGRGVGMDVVKTQLESLHGTIDLSTQPGFGTRFNLSVPLTLTTISALFVKTGDQVFGIPSTSVQRLVRFRPAEIRSMNGQDVISLGESPIAVTSLAQTLSLPEIATTVEKEFLVAVVLTTSDRELVVVVDQLIGERVAVVKSLGPQVRRVKHVSGATLLRTGHVALLLNAATIVRANLSSHLSKQMAQTDRQASAMVKRRILVVDDSLTTRSMVKNILEAAGYDVVVAVDGEEAWARLQTGGVELVVSDVDMPNMDGFDLTIKIRQSAQFSQLPVILVTSRDSDQDQARGAEVGADCYLVKSGFHQSNILDAISSCFRARPPLQHLQP